MLKFNLGCYRMVLSNLWRWRVVCIVLPPLRLLDLFCIWLAFWLLLFPICFFKGEDIPTLLRCVVFIFPMESTNTS